VELAGLWNSPKAVFDQAKNNWYSWKQNAWIQDTPKIEHETFVGSGTRNLSEKGKKAIEELFEAAFGSL
jgi:hypothetical protein